ncbi:MAG: ABC transporter ATP-binding protein [Rhodoluna sp.]
MISLRDLTFNYVKPDGTFLGESPQLNRVNLDIAAGEFALLCGPTGSGKSTLLKTLNGLAPNFTGGILSGQVLIDGKDLTGQPPHEFAQLVGYVNQQPEGFFVADTVVDEIVYGAEQLGFTRGKIKENLEKISEILDIADLLERDLATLSGGQQQRVAIASALIAGQKILLLDEPTSALDQKAAIKVLSTLRELAHEHGVTVLLAEHRISRVISEVDSMVVVHGDGSVTKGPVATQFKDARFAPPIIELGMKLDWDPLPTDAYSASAIWSSNPHKFEPLQKSKPTQVTIEIEELTVSFGSLRALDIPELKIFGNQVTAIMGENGSGKTTLCWEMQGLGTKEQGRVSVNGLEIDSATDSERLALVAMVPQRAADLLFLNSLAEEFAESDRFAQMSPGATGDVFQKLTGRLDTSLHPRDLSAGQQLALVLAMQIVKKPKVLIFDEPTRGLDYAAKKSLVKHLESIRDSSRSIVLASHDIEFVAMVAERVIVLKKGKVIQDGDVADIIGTAGSLPSQISQITKTSGLINSEQVIA